MTAALPEKFGERLWRFPGGLRLRHFKQMACQSAIQRIKPAGLHRVQLDQQCGPEPTFVVEPGQTVLAGEPIARGSDPLSVTLHAPTSGTVVAIEQRPTLHASARPGPCVIIEADGKDHWFSYPKLDQSASRQVLLEALAERGVVGLGGALFPSHAKLGGGDQDSVLILNGAECEPYIACDEMLMRERPEQIVRGAELMLKALGSSRCVIGIEDTMGGVRRTLMDAVKRLGLKALISVVKVPTIYPEGGERQLIKVLTGLEVPSGGLPIDLGLICHNVATAAATHEALANGAACISRVSTVTGPAIEKPGNFEARIGTPLQRLISAAGGMKSDVSRLVIGGPMMGFTVKDTSTGITKAANCVLALDWEETRRKQPQMPCIRCGRCEDVCPASLQPQKLYFFAREENYERMQADDLFDCIECGACAYVCPSHIPLVDYYRHGKAEIKHRREEAIRATRSRQRFEARERRIAAKEQARQQRLESRKKKLNAGGPDGDAVAAAVARAKERKAATKPATKEPEQ
ncbi:MAG: hypothetical protein DHS20C11_02740 [Lysobacteraceae bacterium]|nr:MAG: hypothetical protein DHS20C11_02740 [Xanthomonadaceae bacterium]